MSAMLVLLAPALGAEASDPWQDTLDRVTPSVVSVRMDRPRAFEGKRRSNSYATGFVIDGENGLLLTNRHVVTPGPTVARAVFLNQEEVELIPIYRDPVHDFGLFRFDPQDLKFLDAPGLPLRPDKAEVGVAVRVVGNDAGEKISILDGTLARLDREAPDYGDDYSDFNTFYVQAATSTSGGSSGSPVFDVDGDVVALNAGGKSRAASSFYLPLERVVRAVELIQEGKPVPRGTLQTRWVYEPYDQLKRLGLSDEAEKAARERAPDGDGLLVLREVLPLGPAFQKLAVGDVLLEVDGTAIHDFATLEGLLDDAVGEPVAIVVERGGERVEAEIEVGDLHALVPDRYVEVGGGVLHDLSIHQAREMQVPVSGVYVADDGYTWERDGIPRKAILVEADGKPLRRIDDLAEVLSGVPDGVPVNFRWYPQGRPQQLAVTSVKMDRTWFPANVCTRDDETGTWPCDPLADAAPAEPPPTPEASFPQVTDKRAEHVANALVRVECDVPYQVGGLPADNFVGGGVVLDAERGWVLVDRDTVPVAMAELSVVVAGVVRVPAKVVALHPIHDLAIVAYDPARVAGLPIVAVELAQEPIEDGDDAWLVSLERDASVEVRETTMRGWEPFGLRSDGAPRFRQTNVEVLDLDPAPDGNAVLVDKKGRMLGFGASMSYNQGRDPKAVMRVLDRDLVAEMLALARGEDALRSMGWELAVLDLPTALERGLSADAAERLLAHDPDRRGVLQVVRVLEGSGVAELAQPGDLVLDLGGQPVTRFREIETRIRGRDSVDVRLLRDGQLVEGSLATEPLDPVDVDRILLWAGLRIHEPHRAARFFGALPGQPYVAWWDSGSPAGRAKVFPQRSILAVDGVEVTNLDSFLAAVGAVEPGSAVRLDLISRQGEREALTVEPDERFWPTEELLFEDGAWSRRPVD